MRTEAIEGLYADEADAWRSYNAVPPLGQVDLGRLLDAHSTSQRAAVMTADEVISYEQLYARAGRWLDTWRAAGIEPGTRIGLLASREAACYPVIYACLLAGYTYVPLDEQSYGVEIAALAARAETKVVVGNHEQVSRLRTASVEATLLSFDEVLESAEILESARRDPLVSPAPGDRPAYVIYTSGTTGRPKGVAVSRDSIANLALWHQHRHDIRAGDRLSQNAPLVFDPSAQQIVGAWVSGATVNVVPEEVRLDPEEMVRWLRTNRITHLDAVTAHWASLTQVDWAGLPSLPDLRWSVVAGESMYGTQAKAWLEGLGRGSRLDNIYGPTEATVNATQHEVDQECEDGRLPIGRPLPGYRIYVVDDDGALCPPGLVGELVIAGAGVALGYDGEPALTDERFVTMLVDGVDERVYRTGDLARLDLDLPAGPALFFEGRRDRQVKISGIRIELDHIETVVAAVPGVVTAAALVRSETTSSITVVFAGSAAPDVVRAEIAGRLPGHVNIGVVRRLDTLPLTGSGKVDSRAIERQLELHQTPEDSSRTSLAPPDERTSEMLSAVQDAWSRELGLQIDPDVAFSALGGSSLAAFRIVATLRSSTLPARGTDFLPDPTARSLADAIAGRLSSVQKDDAAVMREREIRSTGSQYADLAEELFDAWDEPFEPLGPAPRLGPMAEAWTTHRTHAMGTAVIEVEVFGVDTAVVVRAVAHVFDAHPSLRVAWNGPGRPVLNRVPRSAPVVVVEEKGDRTPVLTAVGEALSRACTTNRTTSLAVVRVEPAGSHVVLIAAPHAVVDLDLASRVEQMLLDQVVQTRDVLAPSDADSWWRRLGRTASSDQEKLRQRWAAFDRADAATSAALRHPLATSRRSWVAAPSSWDHYGGRSAASSTRWGALLQGVAVAAAQATGLSVVPVSLLGRPSNAAGSQPVDLAMLDAVPLLLAREVSVDEASEEVTRVTTGFPHWVAGAVSTGQPSSAPARGGIAYVGSIRVQRRVADIHRERWTTDLEPDDRGPWVEVTDHVGRGQVEVVAAGVAHEVVDNMVGALARSLAGGPS